MYGARCARAGDPGKRARVATARWNGCASPSSCRVDPATTYGVANRRFQMPQGRMPARPCAGDGPLPSWRTFRAWIDPGDRRGDDIMTGKLLAATAAALLGSTLAAQAEDFPDGPGKQTFVAVCGGCHEINRVRPGYTPEGWRTVVRMMQNFHAPVPDEEWAAVTDYLIKNFPERKRPPAVIIAGPVEASIKEWAVPTAGSRPHDPMAARDGSIWYTGQLANTLGRLDP